MDAFWKSIERRNKIENEKKEDLLAQLIEDLDTDHKEWEDILKKIGYRKLFGLVVYLEFRTDLSEFLRDFYAFELERIHDSNGQAIRVTQGNYKIIYN